MGSGMKYLLCPPARRPLPNIYYWYYAAQVMHNMSRPRVGTVEPQDAEAAGREAVPRQGSLCERKLGPARDQWGRRGGRLMTTSLSCLTLEIYYRYLPLFKADKQ